MNAIAPSPFDLLPASAITAWADLPSFQRQIVEQGLELGALPQYWLQPETEAQLATVLAAATAHRCPVLICGSGSKLSWGDLGQSVTWVISTARINRLIENATGDLTVTVEAGMQFAQLQAILAEHRLFVALDPTYPDQATMGGILATADAGSLRHRYGGVRDLILGFQFLRADGQRAKAGGRVVKNVAGYDLMKLFTGSYGTLGVMTQVTLRTYPLPEAYQTVVLTGELDRLTQGAQKLTHSTLTPIAQDWLSAQAIVQTMASGWGEVGPVLALRFGTVTASVQEQVETVQQFAQTWGLGVEVLGGNQEIEFWQHLSQPQSPRDADAILLCKLGCVPTSAPILFAQVQALDPEAHLILHSGSGLGHLRGRAAVWGQAQVEQLRSHCQEQGGFLSVLEAPRSLKEQLNIWGYQGNALPLMQRIKDQFDGDRLLNPGRFVVG